MEAEKLYPILTILTLESGYVLIYKDLNALGGRLTNKKKGAVGKK